MVDRSDLTVYNFRPSAKVSRLATPSSADETRKKCYGIVRILRENLGTLVSFHYDQEKIVCKRLVFISVLSNESGVMTISYVLQ